MAGVNQVSSGFSYSFEGKFHRVDFYVFFLFSPFQPSAHPFGLKASIFTPLVRRLFKTDAENLPTAAKRLRGFLDAATIQLQSTSLSFSSPSTCI